jgi:hypothetical protein
MPLLWGTFSLLMPLLRGTFADIHSRLQIQNPQHLPFSLRTAQKHLPFSLRITQKHLLFSLRITQKHLPFSLRILLAVVASRKEQT